MELTVARDEVSVESQEYFIHDIRIPLASYAG